MTQRLYILREKKIAFTLALSALLVIVLGINAQGQDAREDDRIILPVAVTTAHFEENYVTDHRFTGRVASRRNSALGFSMGGRIAEISVDIGDHVSAGDVLAQLDLSSLEARRDSLEARQQELTANLRLAEQTLSRARETNSEGHTSEATLDRAVANEAQLRAALSGVEAEKRGVEADIRNQTIIAPFDGVIDNRSADEGAVVNAGQSVLVLIEAGQLEAQIGIPPQFAPQFHAGDSVTLYGEQGQALPATLLRMASAIRSDTRTQLATFALPPDQPLRDGDLVDLVVEKTEFAHGFWVPMGALTADLRGLWRLYVVETVGSGELRLKTENVQVLYNEAGRAFVTGSVQDGATIVREGVSRLAPNQQVRVITNTRSASGEGQ